MDRTTAPEAKELDMTNDKKIDRDTLSKVQGGKGKGPAMGSSGRTAAQFAAGKSKGAKVGAKRH